MGDIDHHAMECEVLPYGPRTRACSGAPTKEPAFGSARPGRSKTRNRRVASGTPDSGRGRWISSCFLTRSDGGGDPRKQVASPGPARPLRGHARTARGQRAEAEGTKKTLSYPRLKMKIYWSGKILKAFTSGFFFGTRDKRRYARGSGGGWRSGLTGRRCGLRGAAINYASGPFQAGAAFLSGWF